MRGKHDPKAPHRQAVRITPADAGKTASFETDVEMLEDHPRGCGENKSAHGRLASLKGSPPRMRGKQNSSLFFNFTVGITPADAGKTTKFPVFCARYEDHPRGCGEN